MENNKRSLAFVIESLHCGGAEKSLVTLLQNIETKKYTIDLFLLKRNGEFEKFVPSTVNFKQIIFSKNSNILKYFSKKLNYFLARKTSNSHTAQIYWKFNGENYNNIATQYDIAIAYNQGFSTYFVSENIKATYKYCWLNTDYLKAGYKIELDKHYYKKFDKIVCVSEENENIFRRELERINVKFSTTVIKDIVDDEFIYKQSEDHVDFVKSEGDIYLLTIGRLVKAKGYNLAIQACKELVDNGHNVKWFVIGEGNERTSLEKIISQNNLNNHFILLGYKENPYPYIKHCDLYVQSSVFEGLGLSLIEASILKKPIVTTNFQSAYGIIEHGKTGVICETTSSSISNAIDGLIKDKGLQYLFIKNLAKKNNKDKQIILKKVYDLIERHNEN